MTLQEIADVLGISKQRVHRIEQSAIRKASAILDKYGYTFEEWINELPAEAGGQDETGKQLSGEVRP